MGADQGAFLMLETRIYPITLAHFAVTEYCDSWYASSNIVNGKGHKHSTTAITVPSQFENLQCKPDYIYASQSRQHNSSPKTTKKITHDASSYTLSIRSFSIHNSPTHTKSPQTKSHFITSPSHQASIHPHTPQLRRARNTTHTFQPPLRRRRLFPLHFRSIPPNHLFRHNQHLRNPPYKPNPHQRLWGLRLCGGFCEVAGVACFSNTTL